MICGRSLVGEKASHVSDDPWRVMLDLSLASSEGRDREGPLQFLDEAMRVRTLFQEDTVELGEER